MTDNEMELIHIIRDCEDQERALMTATAIILDFLKQHVSSEGQVSDCPRVPA